ncbi:MAG: HNH endonuclease [Chlamydiia bacterium]|nr:HNH endonuclease [Chlamydiia bacterium]
MINQSELKEHLYYNKSTGVFTRLIATGNRVTVNEIAGCTTQGYIIIGVLGAQYRAHRLAFLYMTGKFPEHQVDHKDHNRANNSWSNLRLVTHQENQKNCPMRITNNSGCVGVVWDKEKGMWLSQIMVNGKNKYLGRFKNIKYAITARKQAESKYNFHQNHGELK